LAAAASNDNLLIVRCFQVIYAMSKNADVAVMRRDYAIRFRLV